MSASARTLTEGAASPATVPVADGRNRWLPLVPLMVGTFLGTLNNNIVNVPMKQILTDLRVPLSQGALVIIAFNLTFAVLMPITGWLGDRVGRRRLFCCAVATVAAGGFGAMFATSLPMLIGFRVVQGAGTAAILPTVMALIGDLYGHERRGRALGIWAATNGLGQAAGPPLGGLIAGMWSWRWTFAPAVPLAVVAAAGALLILPPTPAVRQPIDWRGAVSLTAGAALVIGAFSAIPIAGLTSPVVWVMAAVGMTMLVAFAVGIRRRPAPFIPPRLLVEPSFLRSSLAVGAQMFCLGAMLLAAPLYLTKEHGVSPGRAGLLIFVLPGLMTVLAPVAGRFSERYGPRRILRAGVAGVVVAEIAALAEFGGGAPVGWSLEGVLALAGVGVAFVQTPAATGATRSPAGRLGPGLGLFNLVRFAGSALGAAWVSISLSGPGGYALLFAGCLVVAALGVAGMFAGRDPLRAPAATSGQASSG